MKKILMAGLVIILYLFLLTAGRATSSTRLEPLPIKRTTKTTLCMTLPKDSILTIDPVFSSDGSLSAAVFKRGRKTVLMIGGKEVSTYEAVRDISFDRHNALNFAGFRDGEWHIVTGDKESKGYESIECIGALAGGEDTWWMGQTGKDAKHVLIRGQNEIGKPIRNYQPVFSTDRKHLAVTGLWKDEAVVIVDGVELAFQNNVGDFYFKANQPYFDEDGKLRFVRNDRDFGSNTVEFNGKKHKNYVSTAPVVTSPDGRHVAYAACNNPDEGSMMIRDGKEGKRYPGVGKPVFSPDSRKLAYVVHGRKSSSHPSTGFMEENETQAVVLEEKQGRDYARVSEITFSPDSASLAYIATDQNGRRFLVIDERAGKPYEEIADITFSPNSRHYAFRARADYRWFVVVDGNEGESFHWVGAPLFSADSRHVTYGTRGGITLLKDAQGNILSYPVRVVGGESVIDFQVDGRGLTYDGHKSDERLWSSTNAWIYTSRNEDELYWVDETIVPRSAGASARPVNFKTGPKVSFVRKSPGSKPMPFSMSYAHPNIITGQYDRIEIPALFTFIPKDGRVSGENQKTDDEGEYSMVLQKFDLREKSISGH